MLFDSRAGRSLQLCIICLAITGFIPEIRGQQRIFAKVEPNAEAINSSADVYDPVSGTFGLSSATMTVERQAPTASVLLDGKVLITGGYNGSSLSSAEIYNPGSGTFTATTGAMSEARSNHAAVVLQSGRALVVGGFNGSSYSISAELYDPSAGTFSTAGSLTAYRGWHTATLLSDGKVLIVGGFDGTNYLQSAELYDPTAATFTATAGSLTVPRKGHTATLLPDGKVLIAGGQNSDGYLNSAEIYDPSTGKFTATGNTMTAARFSHSATLLSTGKVLVAGGYNGSYINSADIYDPSTGRFSATSGAMTAARSGHAAASLLSGKVLISGGYNGAYLKSAEVYDPSAGTFSGLSSSMSDPRQLHTATVLSNGRVLLAGGQNAKLVIFDVNVDQADNVSPNIVFSADSTVGFVAYAGSGTVLAFSPQTGKVLQRIDTGGHPVSATPLADGKTLAVVSALENRIFLIDMAALRLQSTYTFSNALFGFGSVLSLSPDGKSGYISSTGTGEVIKFATADGKESARLKGIPAPVQITVSKDGSLLMVVDTSNEELNFVDSTSMTQKYAFKPKTTFSTADFSIFTKAILSPDGSSGIVVCRDGAGGSGRAFIFRVSSGELLDTETVGLLPGFTGITPNGQNWVVLSELDLSLIPTYDPKAIQTLALANGDALGSANIAFSSDSRYAFYASSAHDLVFQHDLIGQGVVGQVQVGDDPNKSLEQPAGIAITPDGKTVAVLEFVSNNIDLLTSVTTLEAPKFIISGAQFSGVSLVNLSGSPTTFTLYALDNYGQIMTGADLVNPVEVVTGPNGQISKNISEIFNFDLTTDHVGRLSVYADQPKVAGYLSIGQITPTWFGYYLNRMDGLPLFRQQLYDWVVPEIGAKTGETVQLDIVNPNHTQQTYDLRHFAKDGTLLQEKTGNIAYPTNRTEQLFTDLFTTSTQDKVLITGGLTSTTTNSSAETYDVSARTFSSTGTMVTARQGHTSTLLYNGKILVAGGNSSSTILSAAETYDITTAAFTATTGSMINARYRHTATLLPSGKVLVAGGQNSSSINSTAETYDPATGTFTATTGSMTTARDAHTATLLSSGRVLIVGGINGDVVTNTAEIYDPATGAFTSTGSMATGRAFHTATLLSNGRVLIAGGYNGAYLNSAEIYDPSAGTFRAAAGTMNSRRNLHTATLMADGKVLLAGGSDGAATLNSVEIYDPSGDAFTAVAGTMSTPRKSHTASLLSNDKVLFVGGNSGSADLATAETYDPSTRGFESAAGTLSAARSGHAATYLVAGNEGFLRISCRQGLVFSEFVQATMDGSALNGIDIQKYAGITKLYSPQFANTPAFRSIVTLINGNADQDAQAVIKLHGADGRVLGTSSTQTIPRNGKFQISVNDLFQQDSSIQNVSGWLEVNNSIDRVVGTVGFTDDDNAFNTTFELLGAPLSHFVFPMVAADATYHMGLAFLNANDSAANVKMELWGPDGSLKRSTTFTISPGARSAQYLDGFFRGMDPILIGNVRVSSDQPLHSFALIHDTDVHFIAAVPAILFPEAQ